MADQDDVMREKTATKENVTSKDFTFATPSFVSSPEKIISFGVGSEHVFAKHPLQTDAFTFAAPAILPQYDAEGKVDGRGDHVSDEGKPYIPRISRKIYKPPINVFTQALKDTAVFDQLKKHSRSQSTAENIKHSITCTNVPKPLLTKTAAKDYFTKFGQILKITLRPKKQMITICYVTKDAANTAYYSSGEFQGQKFDMQWASSEMPPKSPLRKKESSKSAVRNIFIGNSEEINAELAAMTGLEYNMHGGKSSNILHALSKSPFKKSRAKDTLKTEKKPSKSENINAKVDKTEPESQIQIAVPQATLEELQSMIRQAAHTSEDRYKILEARDKLIRLKQVKPYTLSTAKITRGTCPDMCPEKERLMRESQRQVAVYEQLEGKEYRINHMTAIKQYSRSSADQEEPLSHELRPVSSLKMTMSYLLHEIVDLCEQESTNLAEWFHFLWDRTRGIRKDITQQELCCGDSVELVEQCARFHIVCSERLCTEEPSVFDKKINTENLTKCLQTLKYMYHDLWVKGVACKNEPEFRGYIILLNLNNGNFMWDVQKLPISVQKSPEIKFAIKVYSSIESHNFCRFFQLVRETSYLNACILLRYFSQVRVKALSVMVKAFCRTTSVAYPLYELIDILGFEDENEAIYFCEQVGLNLSNNEMDIMLNRKNFTMPICNIDQGRAVNVVESKRTRTCWTIGQCIAGGTMPEKTYKNHKPHVSFDSRGYLTPDAINANDQNKPNKNLPKQDRNDPYEFMEEESFKSSQKLRLQAKNNDQTDSSSKLTPLFPAAKNIEAKQIKQISSSNDDAIFMKPAVVFHKSEANLTTDTKFEAGVPFGTKTATTSASFVSKSEKVAAFGTKTEMKTPFGVKSAQFGVKPNENVQFSPKPASNLGESRKNTMVFSKPEMLPPKQATAQLETCSPFAMATNKSIFSGAPQGNIFAKPSNSISVFGNSQANKQNEVKAGKIAETVAVEDNFKVPRNLPDPKEQARMKEEMQLKQLEEAKRKQEAEKLKQLKLEREQKLQQIEKEASSAFDDLENEVTKEICSSIVNKEIDIIKMYNTLSNNITETLLGQVVRETCQELVKNEIQMQRKLREISERIKNRRVIKYYKIWKQYASKKRRQRQALDETPVWLQKRTLDECARLLYHREQDVVVANMRRKRFKKVSEEPVKTNLAPIEAIVHAGIKENLRSSDAEAIPNTFWKLVISWPDLEHKVALWRNKRTMNEYLTPEDFTSEPIIKSYSPNPYETLNICIRHFEGLINEYNIIGTDGLLFIAAASESTKAVKRRLMKTILSRSKLMPIPMIVVFLGEGDVESENVEVALDLETLLESGYVSEYTVVFEKEMNESMILRFTQCAALWLTANKSPSVPLEMDFLNEALNGCLTEELWLRVQGHSNFNKHLASGLDDPKFIINLHNEAVAHLIDIFLDQESLQYTDFPPEFKRLLSNDLELPCGYEYFDDAWKKEDNRQEVEQIMTTFLMPYWRYEWPITDLSDLHSAIKRYCQQVLTDSNYNSISCDILSNLFLMSDGSTELSFVDVLLEIIKEKIRQLNENLRVVYNKNHVKHFRTLPWWFKSSVLIEYTSEKELRLQNEFDEQNSFGEPFEKKRKVYDSEENDEFCSIYDQDDTLASFCKETQDQVMTVHNISHKFESDLEEQRTKNRELEEMLEKALMDENVSDFLTERIKC